MSVVPPSAARPRAGRRLRLESTRAGVRGLVAEVSGSTSPSAGLLAPVGLAALPIDQRPGRTTADKRVHRKGLVGAHAVEEVEEVLQITFRED